MSTQRKFTPVQSGLPGLLHLVRHAMRDIALTWLACLALGALVTEVVGVALTGSWPTLNVHLAAVAVGLLSGYAGAATIALREMIHVALETMERVVSEIEHLGTRLTHEVEEHTGHREPPQTAQQLVAPEIVTTQAAAAHNGHSVAVMVRPMD